MSLPLVVNPQQIPDEQLPGLKIVDLRMAADYEQGHLPGAIHMAASLLNRSEPPQGGLLPDAAGAENLTAAIGLNSDDHVLVYDDGGATSAARMVWVLHAYGFHSVSFLNGGFPAWRSAGRSIDVIAATAGTGNANLRFVPGNMLTVDQLLSDDNSSYTYIDVRSAAEYDGSDVRAERGGHVPNAIHSEWTDVFDEEGALKDDDTLRTMMAELNIKKEDHALVYCQTHQRSAVTYLVLKHLGYDKVSAMDGAWSVWGNRDDTPVA